MLKGGLFSMVVWMFQLRQYWKRNVDEENKEKLNKKNTGEIKNMKPKSRRKNRFVVDQWRYV